MNIIAIVVVMVIFWIIRSLCETRKEEEESPLEQRIRINEMKMVTTVNGREGAEVSSRVMKEKMEEGITNESTDISDEEMSQEENGQENILSSDLSEETLKVLQGILSELGCQPKKENERELSVAYQGENFVVKTGGHYAQIWDPAWANISVNDPNFEKMKTAANIANFDFGPSIVWTSPNEDGMVILHSKREILLHPNIPDKNSYIKSVFDSFFEKKENMRGQFHALINQQQQAPKSHRPVGFATAEDEN